MTNPTTKEVQDKDGNVTTVPFETPCHAGKNGNLPVMLDVTLDAAVFTELAERATKAEAAREEYITNRKYKDDRTKAYGTAEEQLEYAVENGWDALTTRNMNIKSTYPKRNN